MDKDYIISVVKYIADNHTIKEAMDHFGKSESSIKKYLAKFRDKEDIYYEERLAEKLRLSQQKKILEGQKIGGTIGKRGKSYPEFTAIMYANAYINSGLSLEGLAELSKIPKSTLHEMIRGVEDAELQQRIDEYIKEMDDKSWKR